MNAKEVIARRAAREMKDGDVVNLGAGLPGMIAQFLPESLNIFLQTENGIIGAGPKDPKAPDDIYCSDASENLVSIIPGGAVVDSSVSFGIIRGGHVDITVLGCMQADQEGSMANWMIPGGKLVGMGGAMDLVTGAKRVIVVMEHCTKRGEPKVLRKCTYPLTGYGVVDTIITELCYIKVTADGLLVKEIRSGVTVDMLRSQTEADLIVAPDLKEMNI